MTPVTLQLKWKHQFQFAGYYAAKAQGYYQAAGLDVSFVEAPADGSDPALPVLKGQADFGIADSNLVLLRSRGYPVVVLGAIYQHSPLIFLLLQRSGIENIHELAGKRVMLQQGADEALLAYLIQEGIDPARIIHVPHSFDLQPLIKGEVDAISAYSTDEPFYLKQAGLEYLIFNPRAGGIDFYGDSLFTTEQQLRQHPERVKAFREASLKGWAYAMQHSEEMIDLILQEYGDRLDRAHLQFEAEQSRRLILPNTVETGYMNPGRWRAIADVYTHLGMLPKPLDLTGFLYETQAPSPPPWVYVALGLALTLLTIVSWIAWRFYQLQRSLRYEIAERIQVEKELQASEKRARVLADHAPFPVIITVWPTGQILYVNYQALQKFELDPQTLPATTILNFYGEPTDRQRLLKALEHEDFIQNWQLQLQSATGKPFWANLSISKIEFDHQRALFTAVVDITEQRQLQKRLTRLAITDDLTGLYNRRYFMQRGTEEFNRAVRYPTALSVLMLDIDHFKLINDHHGHEAGDRVLRHLAQLIQENVRPFDLVGRLGGEEFAVLLPNCALAEAIDLAERLRYLAQQECWSVEEADISISVSGGVASLTPEMDNLKALLKQADQALYQAKRDGRNRVIAG
ncbi:ABC transporter substrate-binding protein [Synechocystis sp. LKSZ1]